MVTVQMLETFLQSADFQKGCIDSTRGSWGGTYRVVELFDDGTWQVCWSRSIGNQYQSPGILMALPTLRAIECIECNEDEDTCFEQEAEELRQDMRDRFHEFLVVIGGKDA